jgi:cobalamin biosynthetic protein CobC
MRPASLIPASSVRAIQSPLEHGGRLRAAATAYAIPLADWLDLSTGINPEGWPVPANPAAHWMRLPETEDGLDSAAAGCYGCHAVLPTAGSQAAIQVLPRLRRAARVGVPSIGYQEHARAWAAAGHQVLPLEGGDPFAPGGPGLDGLDVLILINPNNPTGRLWSAQILLDWHRRLAARGGWLIVDEAFIDPTPGRSLAPDADRPGLIVLRSLGKFFGLAGARVGFVLGDAQVRDALAGLLGPWSVNGPARDVARLALSDRGWQAEARRSLPERAERLADLLTRHGLRPDGGTALFQWVCRPDAARIHDDLARRGIWVRRFDRPPALRFGLPGLEPDWQRLAAALAQGSWGHGGRIG